jgi:hypothetical protein
MVKKHTKKQRRRKNKKSTRGGTSPRSNIKTITEKVRDNKFKIKSSLAALRILQEKRKINFEKLKTNINTIDKLQNAESNDIDLLKKELSMCKNELDLCKTNLEQYKKPTRMLSDDYIDIEPIIQPYYDLGTARQESQPYYDLSTADEQHPHYDLGTAHQESQPYYDLATADEQHPHYDLGTAHQESQPYYDLATADEDSYLKVSQKRKTLPIIVKETLEKYNIKNKDDLDRFCGGPRTRKKFYDAVKKICIEENCSGKLSHTNIIFYYEHLLPGYKRYKPKHK